MSSSVARQFGNMLASRLSLPGGGQDAPPPPSKQKAIHETVTYPRVLPVPGNDSCRNPSMSYEHLLECGHLIVTAKADESCAPNCYHVANGWSQVNEDAQKKGKEKALPFYCDACVETENEALVPSDMTSWQAEKLRRDLRQTEANQRGKQTKYRKCYIGLKITSLPCHTDGVLRNKYIPRKQHHPFDTAIPHTGDNFFEDMLIKPSEEPEREPEPASDAYASAVEHLDSSLPASSPANLGEGGANYLRYAQALSGAHKRAKEGQQKTTPMAYNAKKTPSQSALGSATTSSPIVPSSDIATEVTSPQRLRKKPIVIDDDDEDYVVGHEEDAELFKKPAKRQKKTAAPLPPPPPPVVKRKVGRPRGIGKT